MTPGKKQSSRRASRPGPEDAELSFEAALARLEEIVTRLEEGEVPLEESLAAYAEGTRLVRRCLERLTAAEAMIRELSEGPDGFRLVPSGLVEESEEDDAEAEAEEDDDNGDEADDEEAGDARLF